MPATTPRRQLAPKLPAPAAWARRTETQSLAPPTDLLRQARANTRAAARDVVFLARLAREVALARGAELTLAYRQLVWVMPGFRKRQRAGRTRVTSEVCVVLVVRRKGGLAADDAQHLPRWLLTFADREGHRLPFAVPTDVQDAADWRGATAQADSGLWVQNNGWPRARGHFAGLVTLAHAGGQQTCVLSAQHVLTPYADGEALQVAGGLAVLPLDVQGQWAESPRLATSLPFGGVLRGDERPERPSFDVQLAAVEAAGESLLRQRVALARWDPTQPWVRSADELLLLDQAGWFHLLTPDNHAAQPRRGAIKMTLAAAPTGPVGIPYALGGPGQAQTRTVYHTGLLRFDALGDAVPLAGDSGSPIVARRPGGGMTLVAMHIAGNGQGLSWAIPAWRLFDLGLWRQYPPGAQILPENA